MRFWVLLFFCASCVGAEVQLSDPAYVIRELVNGNYQKQTDMDILELFEVDPLFFDRIVKDVIQLIQDQTPSIATERGHLSNWSKPEGMITQYSLLNRSGRYDDYSTDHDRSIQKKRFAHGSLYPSLDQFIKLFPHAVNFRINVLHGKSSFTQHQEDLCFIHNKTHDPALRVRFHLPIATHDQALMLMEGNLYRFNPGKIYFFHNGCIHDGVNLHPTQIRVHLLWDMLLTEDTFTRMFARALPLSFLSKSETTALFPVQTIGIDPKYKQKKRALSYEKALQTKLCPIQ